MLNRDQFAELYRDSIRKQLPAKAFLKTDRGKALFVTNAPRFNGSPIPIQGASCSVVGDLMYISPLRETLCSFETTHAEPIGDLSRSLVRFIDTGYTDDTLVLFAAGLKLMLLSTENDIRLYDKAVRQSAAKALRTGETAGIYASARIADALILQDTEHET